MSTFPEHLRPESITPREVRPTLANESRSGAVKRTSRGGQWFEFDYAWPPYLERQHRDLMGFVASMQGGLTSFELVVPSTEPLGTAAGTPVIKGSNLAGDRRINSRGWFKNSRVLTIGDKIRIKQKVYIVTDRVKSDANGETQIDIDPGLLSDTKDSEGIVVRGLSFRVFIVQGSISSPMVQTGAGIAYRTSMTFREDWI